MSTATLPEPDPSCPFCAIASQFPPVAPSSTSLSSIPADPAAAASAEDIVADPLHPEKTFPPSYVILSTPDVVAFLDIAPLTRGHVLVATRRHRVKTVDMTTSEGAEVGRTLPLIARSVLRAVFPDSSPSENDYNFVQNNGPRAAQVVPHIHFHLVPRPPSAYSSKPSFAQQSWLSFGRGMRTELDDDDSVVLVAQIRDEIKKEVLQIKHAEGVDLESLWGFSPSVEAGGGTAADGGGKTTSGGRTLHVGDRERERL